MDNQDQSRSNLSEKRTSSPKPDQKSLLMPVLLSVLVTALVAGGAVYAWQKSELSKIKEEKNEEIQSLQKEIINLEEEVDTLKDEKEDGEEIPADWKTYRNEEYGISFRYPKDWRARSFTRESGGSMTGEEEFLICLNPSDKGREDCAGLVTIDWRVSFEKILSLMRGNFAENELEESSVQLDGVEGRLLKASNYPSERRVFSPVLVVENNGFVYTITVGKEDVFEGVVSTFEFIEATKTDSGAIEKDSFSCGEKIEYRGDAYSTVKIGNQCWFAESLCLDCEEVSSEYNNIGESENWSGSNNCGKIPGFDHLHYQWKVAMNGSTAEGVRGLCPKGWHIPTGEEWDTLENWLASHGFEGTEGDALKDLSYDGGWCKNGNSCGETGFLALPGGYRDPNGRLDLVDSRGSWWTSSSNQDGEFAYNRWVYDASSEIGKHEGMGPDWDHGHAVRCLRD